MVLKESESLKHGQKMPKPVTVWIKGAAVRGIHPLPHVNPFPEMDL